MMRHSIRAASAVLSAFLLFSLAGCSSGSEPSNNIGTQYADKAYDIEKKYGHSPEEIFTSAFYHTRPKQFFDFYKEEMIINAPEPTDSGRVLAAMEQA